MKLKEYIENLQKLMTDNPGSENFTVITAIDAEGNGFSSVYYEPEMGFWDEADREFLSSEQLDDDDESLNAVCVN